MDKKLQNAQDRLAGQSFVLKRSARALQRINYFVAEMVSEVSETSWADTERNRLVRARLQYVHEILLGNIPRANSNQFLVQKIWLLTDSDRDTAIACVEDALLEFRIKRSKK